MTTPRKTRASAGETTVKGTSQNQAETMDKKIETPLRFRLKVFGIGGAGTNAVRHIAAASGLAARQARAAGRHLLTGVDLIAIHTDLQALNTVDATEKIQLGAAVVHGMGTGGDVE